MPGYIEDRWMRKTPDPVTGEKKKKQYGQGLRYRVCGIPGVKDESFKLMSDAKNWLATAQTDSRRGNYIDPRLGQMTLQVYVETIWWPARHDPLTTGGPMKSKIWNHILPHLGALPIGTIDSEHLRAWLATLRRKGTLSESTIEVIWIHLTSIFKTAVGKRIARNPCSEMSDERPSGGSTVKARAWSREEVLGLRKALPEWYQICLELGVSAGLRQGEAFGFSADDIDEQAGVILLRRQLQWDSSKAYFKLPKGGKEREIPLSDGLRDAILAHKEKRAPAVHALPWKGPGNGQRAEATVSLLASTWFSNPIHHSRFNRMAWKPALAALGLISAQDAEDDSWEPSRELMFHRNRHTYASVQLRGGEDVVSLSHWMGHSSPDITWKTYAHFMPEKGRRGRTAVDAWLVGQ